MSILAAGCPDKSPIRPQPGANPLKVKPPGAALPSRSTGLPWLHLSLRYACYFML